MIMSTMVKRKQSSKRQYAGHSKILNDLSKRDQPGAKSSRRQSSSGREWIYGTHAVQGILANPLRRCHRIFVTGQTSKVVTHLPANRSWHLPEPEIYQRAVLDASLPRGAIHQGIAVEVDPLPSVEISDICDALSADQSAVVVILDQATDPRNIGAVLRSAAAFGANACIMQNRHAPDVTGVMAKAASGALEKVPLIQVTNIVRSMKELQASGFWCVGLDGNADRDLASANLSGRIALAVGAEGRGLRRLTREHCDIMVRIPISSAVENLNLSTAAAVALYEIARCTNAEIP